MESPLTENRSVVADRTPIDLDSGMRAG